MLIDLRSGSEGLNEAVGIQHHNLNGDGSFFGLIRSPYHHEIPVDATGKFSTNIRDYANYYVNDSVCIMDNASQRFSIARDWPGNTMLYYWFGAAKNCNRLVVSDDIRVFPQRIANLGISKHGIRMYFENPNHLHSYTIYERVEILPPGFYLDFDLANGGLSVKPWFQFKHNITVKSYKQAVDLFRAAIDDSIQRLVSKDDTIALMFSGGSDSALLLDRLVSLGFRNVSIFNVAVGGRVTESERAKRVADYYDVNLECIEVSPKQAFKDWLDITDKIYMGPRVSRINGWSAALASLYKKLHEQFDGKPIKVMWGFVHPFHAPYVRVERMPFIFMAYSLLRLFPTTDGKVLNRFGHFALQLLSKNNYINKRKITQSQLPAIESVIADCFDHLVHPDELVNLKLILGYTRMKEWTMHRFRTIPNLYYAEARNIFPFYDRRFQETTVTMSLRSRFGGFMKWLKMSSTESRKNLTIQAVEKDVPRRFFLGGNYESRPDWRKLYENKACYSAIIEFLSQPKFKKLIEYLTEQNLLTLPGSYDEFLHLNWEKVYELSGAVILLAHLDPDKIDLSSLH